MIAQIRQSSFQRKDAENAKPHGDDERVCGKLGVWGQTTNCLRVASVSGRLVSRLSMASIMRT